MEAGSLVLDYYNHPSVSNSDLSWLDGILNPKPVVDPTNAYRFGNLLDAQITEESKLDYFKRTCEGEVITQEEWDRSLKMRKSFMADPTCVSLHKLSEFQKIFITPVQFEYCGFSFSLTMRCKFDLWMPALKHGGDIKSTASTSQKAFVDACEYFEYFRQRYLYMQMSGSKKDILIGISKSEPHKVFKLPIVEGDKYWLKGKQQAERLAFEWYKMF